MNSKSDVTITLPSPIFFLGDFGWQVPLAPLARQHTIGHKRTTAV